ncbi:MAG TPA: hypothetical protein ENK23_08305, partial [Sorangium sp.]|nr:hypothetical protein [Sorangium sp.]
MTIVVKRIGRARRGGAGLVLLALVASGLCDVTASHAAGLYFGDRGVRPLARAGAFTAGADDLGAIWYNPAGVFDAGSQLLVDGSWLNFSSDYTRRGIVEQRDPNSGAVVSRFEQTYDTVEGTTPFLPLPTLAGSFRLDKKWVLAIALEAPSAALTSYPKEVNGKPAPSRYSLITLDGSALVVAGVWAAFAPNDQWRFGAGLEVLTGKFVATTMFGTCVPEKFLCATEQPSWDSLTQLSVGPIIAPSGNLGVTYIPLKQLRIGASLQLPFWVRAPATIKARLPAAPIFEKVSQQGQDADASFELPLGLRLGVEYSPIDEVAVELNGSYEAWSMHDSITVTPDKVTLRGLAGFPDPYAIPTQTIVRNFRDTFSLRLGGEGKLALDDSITLRPRLGVSYESSAILPAYLSVMTIDMAKMTAAGGMGVEVGRWRFDATFAHIFGFAVAVPPDEAQVPLLSPVTANVSAPHHVNGGDYA